jgi:hypothetical protein
VTPHLGYAPSLSRNGRGRSEEHSSLLWDVKYLQLRPNESESCN